MTTPTKADILNAAAIERMVATELNHLSNTYANSGDGLSSKAFFTAGLSSHLRADALERIAKDMDDE